LSGSISFSRILSRSIRRRPYRNIATVLCFAFIAGSILSARYLISGTTNSLNTGISRLGADIIVVPSQAADAAEDVILTGQPTSFFFNETPIPEILRTPGVSAICPEVYISTLAATCCSYPVQMVGFNSSEGFTITPWLQSSLKGPLKRDQIIVGSDIVGNVGSQLEFYGQNFTIAAKLAPTGMGMDETVFLRLQDAYTMATESKTMAVEPLNITSGQISAVLVQVGHGYNPQGVAFVIELNVPGSQAIVSNGLVETVANQISATVDLLYVAAASVTLVSLPLIALISSMVINERKKEIGVLRAIGGTRRFVLKLFLAEAITLALIGGAVGASVSFFGMYAFGKLIALSLQIPFLWPSLEETVGEAVLSLAIVVGAGTVAALYPAVKNSRLEPYEAIRSGES